MDEPALAHGRHRGALGEGQLLPRHLSILCDLGRHGGQPGGDVATELGASFGCFLFLNRFLLTSERKGEGE